MRCRFILPILIPTIALAGTLTACSKSAPTARDSSEDGQAEFRIVCLSPALTDMLIDLGLESNIVGRDIWDQQLPETVPRIGDLFQLDYEALITLEPTDVLLQVHPGAVPPFLKKIAADEGFGIVALHIDTLDDILAAMHALHEQLSFAGAADKRAQVRQRAIDLESRMSAALAPMPAEISDALGPVLILHHIQPPAAFGPGSYLVQALDEFGARSAITTGGPWQELDLETIVRIDPWAIMLIAPGTEPQTDPHTLLGALADLDLSAVRSDRVGVLTHPESLLPGTCTLEVAGQMRDILASFVSDGTSTAEPDQ